MRWRLRAPGRSTVIIKGEFGSTEFAANYRAAMEGASTSTVSMTGGQGTVSALARPYLRSAAFAALAPESARIRRSLIDKFVSDYGDLPINKLEHRYVRSIIDGMAATPGMARGMLSAIRTLTALALSDGIISFDPCTGIKRPKLSGDGIHDWTEEEIATFESYYPIGTPARLMFALALYTGQRASDLVRMGRQHIRNGAIEVRPKTKTPLLIPLHPNLKAILEATPSGHLTILVNEHGKPYTRANSLGKRLTRFAEQAGLKGCSIHGLRKSCCRRLAEAGCTEHEIKSISGHKSSKEVERYTRAASQKAMAECAMARTKNASKLTPFRFQLTPTPQKPNETAIFPHVSVLPPITDVKRGSRHACIAA